MAKSDVKFGSRQTSLGIKDGGFLRLPTVTSLPTDWDNRDDSLLGYLVVYDGKIYGYQSGGWTTVDGTAAGSLDAAYNGGQTITVDSADVLFDLDDASNDYGIVIDCNANGTIAKALEFTTAGGGSAAFTTAIDLSDAGITNAISVGANTILGTTAVINFTNFDVDASGNVTIGGTAGVTGAATLSSTLAVTGAITASSSYTGQGQMILDVDNAEAFLIRENGGAADVVTVDTTQDAGDTTLKISSKTTSGYAFHVDSDTTTGNAFHVDADAVTSGNGICVSIASGTMTATGAAISVVDSDNSDREIFAVRDDGTVYVYGTAEGTTAQEIALGDFVVTDGDLTVSDGEVSFATSAAGNDFTLTSTATGAAGVVFKTDHDSASPADNDVIFELSNFCDDDGGDNEEMAQKQVIATDVTATNEDCDIIWSVMTAGTLTQKLHIDSDVNGIVVGSGADAAAMQSSGNYDIQIQTGNSTTGHILIVDGADGDIDLAPNGSGTVTIPNDNGLKVGAGDDFTISLSSDDATIANATQDKDIIFSVNDGGTPTEWGRVDGSACSLLVATNKKIELRDTGIYLQSSSDGQLDIVSDTTIAMSGAVTMDSTLTVTTGMQSAAVARTATDDGTGTGTIADGTSFVTVDADSDANHIITLPTPTPGNVVWLLTQGDSTGFELRTDTPASVAINGGTGENAESAIAAATVAVRCVCVSATYWLCSQFDADGDETKVEVAA